MKKRNYLEKKSYSKKIAVAVLASMMLVTGCGAYEENEKATTAGSGANVAETQTDETDNAEGQTSAAEDVKKEETNEKASEEATENISKNAEYMTTEGFYHLNEVIDSYTFAKEDGNEDVNVKFTGEYSLTSDAKDIITVGGNYDTCEAYIEINGIKKNFGADCVENVAIIDLDEKDTYKEIAVYDAGPSNDPNIIFFRLVDGEIYEMGYACARYDYNEILFDKNGRIIDGYGYISFTDTQVVADYYEIKDNSFDKIQADYESALGEKYTITENITVAFIETENTNVFEAASDEEEYVELKVGDEIILLDDESPSCLYYVELPDGRRGVIRTQLAG